MGKPTENSWGNIGKILDTISSNVQHIKELRKIVGWVEWSSYRNQIFRLSDFDTIFACGKNHSIDESLYLCFPFISVSIKADISQSMSETKQSILMSRIGQLYILTWFFSAIIMGFLLNISTDAVLTAVICGFSITFFLLKKALKCLLVSLSAMFGCQQRTADLGN